jgi:hypothetical protein
MLPLLVSSLLQPSEFQAEETARGRPYAQLRHTMIYVRCRST